MFYSQFILAKKGPLGTIWIAAHLERKLRKNQVADTDIGVSVDSILSPDVPIALRLSSHLLLGVVRIYNRKVNYLFDDCSEALLKVKQAFRSTAVDLPPEKSKAPYHSITLPETFDLDDFELPDNDSFPGNHVDHHVSSKEQITLQDTMDGVTLSTSRFGLDERFGDADTSGVDLDEELFLDKIDTSSNVDVSVDPQSSDKIVAPIKHDHHDAMTPNLEPMIDGVDESVDLMDDAQAPRTPGLLEEPYLSNVQKTSACEDQFETEEGHLTEHIMKENLEKMSGEKNTHDQNRHVDDWSIRDINSDIVIPLAPEVGRHFSDLDFKKPPEVAVEQKSLDNHASAFGSFSCVDTHSSSVSDLAELRPEEIFYNRKDNVDSNISVGDNERSDEGHMENSSNDFRLSADINQQVLQNVLTSSTMEASENIDNVDIDSQEKAENQTCKEPVALSMGNNLNMEEEYHFLVPWKANQFSNSGGNQSIDPKPCNKNDTTSSVQDNAAHDSSENVTLEDTTRDPPLDGRSHAAGCISFPVHNVKSVENLVENIYHSGSLDVLAPEKLRSLTDIADDHSGNLVMDYSPLGLVRSDEGDAGSNFIYGKKRTYTESTLTEQSWYTIGSSGIAQSKRTVESVPDDDDFLSSILAGRNTSVLKLRPTPSPQEISSVKRRRSVPSSGTTKRKILIDDSMVLHGDTIRSQLMNTEDIRRVRKKAPCTRPETFIIQKQFLEDEMFIEPICTGLSIKLAALHNQTHDLGGIVVNLNAVVCASPELGTKGSQECNNVNLCTEVVEGSTAQEVMRESSKEDENEGLMVEDNCGQEAIDAHSVLVDVQDGDYKSSLPDDVIESKLKTISDAEENCSLLEPSEDITDSELVRRPASVTDVVNTTAAESPLLSERVSVDHVSISADLVQIAGSDARFPDNNILCGDITLHNDATYMPSDEKADEVREIGIEDKDVVKDFDYVTAEEVPPLTDEDRLLDTAEGNSTVEAEACINARGMDYMVHTMGDKEIEHMGLFPMNMDLHMEDVLLHGAKFSFQGGGNYPLNVADMGSLGCDYADISCSLADNETDFLNVDDEDDDEVVDATDDNIPNKHASVTDNSGWSSRTRAVANYLQTSFVKQGGNTRGSLEMDNLLIGKTRKEASRMFFELLVLKTKDYVDVEQAHPFDKISLTPQIKLMKSEF